MFSEWPDYILSATVRQPWIVAECHLYPKYYCQGPVASSTLVKKEKNEACFKFVFTDQISYPGTIDKGIYSFILVIVADEREELNVSKS